MQLTMRFLTGFLVLSLALAGGCSTTGAADPQDEIQFKTYSVPAGYGDEVRSMLRSALGDGTARVTLGPTGKLVVLAPRSIHDGVAEFLQELGDVQGPPPAPQPITMSYWIILGAPGSKQGGWSVVGERGLDDISAALDEIVRSQGPHRFELMERVQLSSLGDEHGQILGREVNIEQRATKVGEEIVAHLQIGVRQHRLETKVRIKPGQLVVLGQTGVNEDWQERLNPTLADAGTLYYVITSRLE